MDPKARAVWTRYEQLEMKDNVLHLMPVSEQKHFRPRIILAESLVRPVLQRMHDGLDGNHQGVFKTPRKIQARFWRPGFTSAVTDCCAACRTCGECKPPTRMHPIPSACPLQRVPIDIIGSPSKTKRKNQYILTVQCLFTKWLEAYPLPNQRAVTCARAILITLPGLQFRVSQPIQGCQSSKRSDLQY